MAILKKKEWSCNGMLWDHNDDLPECDECGKNAEQTTLSSNGYSGGVICGDAECWNDYMMNNVFTDIIESTDIYVCDSCETTDSLKFECLKDECLE